MSNAHVCDNCLTVAPIGEAFGWWKLEAMSEVLTVEEKDEYHFCSKRCAAEKLTRLERLAALRSDR